MFFYINLNTLTLYCAYYDALWCYNKPIKDETGIFYSINDIHENQRIIGLEHMRQIKIKCKLKEKKS